MLSNDSRLTGLIAGGLILGGVATAWAATLPTSHACTPADGVVQCISRRGAHWPLLMGLGIAQVAGGVMLLRGEGEGGDRTTTTTAPLSPLAPAAATTSGDYAWVDTLLHCPQIMVIGDQGSGKSTLVKWIAERRQHQGDRVTVIDPHAALGDWDGLDVVGAGLNYDAVAGFVGEFVEDIASRYRAIASQPDPKLERRTLVLEELTNWSSELDSKTIELFDGKLTADIRKTKYRVIKVAHNDTLATTAGKAGTKKTQNAYAKLVLNRKIDPTNPDGVSPAFTGVLTLPGGEPQQVQINPDWRPNRLGASEVQSHPPHPSRTPLNLSEGIDLGNLAPYRPEVLHLEKSLETEGVSQADKVKELHSRGMSQEDVIYAVYGIKKGGNSAYKNARAEYRKILNLEE